MRLCTGRLLAPERVAQEVHEIQPVPASGDAGILKMVAGVGALLEDGAARRQDHHAEPVENTGVTRFVDRIDNRVGTLNVDRDLCVRWYVDPLQLKRETADRYPALHRAGILPDRLAPVGLQRPSGRHGERIPG